jgi:hypothetical protein
VSTTHGLRWSCSDLHVVLLAAHERELTPCSASERAALRRANSASAIGDSHQYQVTARPLDAFHVEPEGGGQKLAAWSR